MTRVRIPADVDRDDTILAGLTARQLAVVAVPTVALWVAFRATQSFIPLKVFVAGALPVCAATVTLLIGRWHGLGADRFALAALRFMLAPRRQVVAPEGIPAMPGWAKQGGSQPAPAPLQVPAVDVDPSGFLDLGPDGTTLVCAASTVNFALRTADEQEALVGAFGRFLNAMDGPFVIVASTARVDLRAAITRLDAGATGLAHPALESAARAHATFLVELTARRELLAHRCYVVFRDRTAPEVAADALGRRFHEAAAALASADVTLTPLTAGEAEAALAGCADPDRPRPAGGRADPHLVTGVRRATA